MRLVDTFFQSLNLEFSWSNSRNKELIKLVGTSKIRKPHVILGSKYNIMCPNILSLGIVEVSFPPFYFYFYFVAEHSFLINYLFQGPN